MAFTHKTHFPVSCQLQISIIRNDPSDYNRQYVFRRACQWLLSFLSQVQNKIYYQLCSIKKKTDYLTLIVSQFLRTLLFHLCQQIQLTIHTPRSEKKIKAHIIQQFSNICTVCDVEMELYLPCSIIFILRRSPIPAAPRHVYKIHACAMRSQTYSLVLWLFRTLFN